MSTLDIRNQRIGPNITANYSSAAVPSDAGKTKLIDCVDYAKTIVADVKYKFGVGLGGIWVSDNIRQAYEYHIKVKVDQDHGAFQRLRRAINLVESGLNNPLVLSDARAMEIKKFIAKWKASIEADSGKTYNNNQNGDLIRDLIADDGWGSNLSYLKRMKKFGYLKVLQSWNMGRTFAVIGDAAGYVNMHGNNAFFKSRDITEQSRLNPNYSWQVAEDETSTDIGKVNSIHLDFSMFESTTIPVSSKLFHACVLIHEATHKFALTADFAYTDDDIYSNLTVPQSVNNADSIAFLCICLFKDTFYKQALDIKTAY